MNLSVIGEIKYKKRGNLGIIQRILTQSTANIILPSPRLELGSTVAVTQCVGQVNYEEHNKLFQSPGNILINVRK